MRFLAFLVLIFSFTSASQSIAADVPELVIYTYDSMVAEGGLGPKIFPAFEKQCGCKLIVRASGDGEQIIGRLQLDDQRKKPTAHVVLGLDESTFDRAKPWLDLEFRLKKSRPLAIDRKFSGAFVPYDYGYFTFIADQETLKKAALVAPSKFSDLLKPEWKRNLILEDPRTSNPGMAFLLYVNQLVSHKAFEGPAVWESLKNQWLTLTPSWDSAYGLFMRQEAPLVWSYTTSQAYHDEHGGENRPGDYRYDALVFEEGLPQQIEGAALVKGISNPEIHKIAESFMDYLESPEVQLQVPKSNWMYPVVRGTALPESFKRVPMPKKIIHLPLAREEVELELSKWVNVVSKSSK